MEHANDELPKVTSLNAFDLISFSPGLDLSGLFKNSHDSVSYCERLLLKQLPEKLMEKVEEVAKSERLLRVKRRKESGIELEGDSGKLGVSIEVYRLTEELVVVEAKRTCGDEKRYSDTWNNKIKPALLCMDAGQ